MKKYFFLAPSQTQQSQARHCGRHQTPEREHLRHHSDLQFETLLLVPITCKTLCTIGLWCSQFFHKFLILIVISITQSKVTSTILCAIVMLIIWSQYITQSKVTWTTLWTIGLSRSSGIWRNSATLSALFPSESSLRKRFSSRETWILLVLWLSYKFATKFGFMFCYIAKLQIRKFTSSGEKPSTASIGSEFFAPILRPCWIYVKYMQILPSTLTLSQISSGKLC